MKNFTLFILIFLAVQTVAQDFNHLAVGEKVKDFALKTINDKEVQFSELNESNSIVLLMLRGYPGYQCPICTRQVGQFIGEAEKLKEKNAVVLLVYPGPSNQLKEYAKDFSEGFDLPDNFYFVLDPDYSMVNKYGLRWDSPRETAYPSTFVIDKSGKIVFSKISQSHGGRAKVDEVLEVLGKI